MSTSVANNPSPVSSPTPPGRPDLSAPGARAKASRKIGAMLIAPPAILALSLIANGARQQNERGNANARAERALTDAFAKVPFKVRLPKVLPPNAEMVRVYLDEPDSNQGFQAYQLNVWYTTRGEIADGGGRTIHIWQTNDKFLSRTLRDPVAMVGAKETIAGQVWHRVIDDRVYKQVVTTFSKRYDDGITLTVDSKDPDLARSAVAALDTAQPAAS